MLMNFKGGQKMAKASINRNYKINAKGILNIADNIVSIENTDTGELIQLSTLFSDFADRTVSLNISYDEDYDSAE